MMIVRRVLATATLLLGIAVSAFSQIDNVNPRPGGPLNKNAIYANLGGVYQLGGGVHLERMFLGGNLFHVSGGIGVGQSMNKETDVVSPGTYIPANINVGLGLKGHFIELGGGPITKLDIDNSAEGAQRFRPALTGGHLQLGYKFVSNKKPGLFFKAYADGLFISPVEGGINNLPEWFEGTINAKMLPTAGVSIGLSF